ncbi:MAG TPA: prepilin-type N-terminal cleavage/methylation domain-containing protein [Firmicutes bacterium]|nr:prepilin-type N-terminal cleavage/methylation domain-containing protein [Bacillota bacterium]
MAVRRTRGFTLVELLLTVALGGALLLVALPAVNAFLTAARLQQAAGELVGTIRELEQRAVVEERAYCIEFIYSVDHVNDGYLIREVGEDGFLAPGGRFRPLPRGVRINYHRLQPTQRLLWLYPTGSPSSGANISLETSTKKCLSVRVLGATGRVRVVKE